MNSLRFNTFMVELIQKSYNIEKFGEAPFQKNMVIEEPEVTQEPEQIVEPQVIETKVEEIPEVSQPTIVETIVEVNVPEQTIEVPEKPKKTRKVTRLN